MSATSRVEPRPDRARQATDEPGSHQASGRRGKHRAKGDGNGVRALVICVLMLIFFAGGWFLLKDAGDRFGSDWDREAAYRSGTIRFGRHGELCRQVAIDNRTGQMTDKGNLPCDKAPPTDAKDIMRERSGGRLDAIRNSFTSR